MVLELKKMFRKQRNVYKMPFMLYLNLKSNERLDANIVDDLRSTCQHRPAHRVAASTRSNRLEELRFDSKHSNRDDKDDDDDDDDDDDNTNVFALSELYVYHPCRKLAYTIPTPFQRITNTVTVKN